MGTDLPAVNPRIRTVVCPYTGETLATVPALNPDVTIVHAQRADDEGNTQIWGLLGVQKEAAFASKRVIVVVEELVDQSVIRADPNRTIIPGRDRGRGRGRAMGRAPVIRPGVLRSGQRVLCRRGRRSRAIPASSSRYLDEFVHGVADRAAYVRKCGGLDRLRASSRVCAGVNYGY